MKVIIQLIKLISTSTFNLQNELQFFGKKIKSCFAEYGHVLKPMHKMQLLYLLYWIPIVSNENILISLNSCARSCIQGQLLSFDALLDLQDDAPAALAYK